MKDNKYGVPINHDNDNRRPLLQPKFTNRFRVFFRGLGVSDEIAAGGINADAREFLTAQVESFDRPNIEFNNKPVTSFIGRGFVHGRPLLGETTFVVRDEITNSAILFLYRQVQAQIDKFYTRMSANGKLEVSPLMGQDTKFTIIMEVMDGRTNHTPLEVWEMYGCTFSSVNFSGNSYEDDTEIAKITVKCSVDRIKVHRPSRRLFQDRDFDDINAKAIDYTDNRDFAFDEAVKQIPISNTEKKKVDKALSKVGNIIQNVKSSISKLGF